jgi:hypothetical protein
MACKSVESMSTPSALKNTQFCLPAKKRGVCDSKRRVEILPEKEDA